MKKPAPFDPFDDAELVADNFRVQVCELAANAHRTAIYSSLDPIKQVETFMGGVLVGMIGVCFASIEPASRDGMMKAIAEYLPQARQQAEAMLSASGADSCG